MLVTTVPLAKIDPNTVLDSNTDMPTPISPVAAKVKVVPGTEVSAMVFTLNEGTHPWVRAARSSWRYPWGSLVPNRCVQIWKSWLWYVG